MSDFKFRRAIRTASSEQYDIYYLGENIGELHIHFMEQSSNEICNLLVTKDLEEFNKENLVDEIVDTIISNPEDFFWINVFKATYEFGIINEPHPDSLKARQKDLAKVLNTFQVAKGQLSEVAAMEYFRGFDYEVKEASDYYDKNLKIDLIGENHTEQIYIQVKLGMVGEQEIIKTVSKVSEINNTKKSKIACIVAEKFPVKSEFLRNRLESELNVEVMFVHKYQVVDSVSKYKRTLK
ncbi:hypothetical protein [Halobacillus halophilus]|uniref:hypothetical protein n=1 Tax=Halobacillus halophilus TaxID=1570 RepID=UPI001CD7AD60|nr:hypothetical protein [Halobacillus halophilus]MCA1012825.1 hypothetical protein [Halobacillus halophilus]